jgi:predicted RNA binding protein YcfA (HicA-like mRNA interferase family)
MKALSGRELARIVERRGWRLLRVNGSHHVTGKPAASCGFPFRSTAASRCWRTLRTPI